MLIVNTFAMGCQPPGCQLDVINHVPNADKIVHVSVNGGPAINMNATFTFTNASTPTIVVLDTAFIGAVSRNKYVFKEWDYGYNGFQYSSTPTLQVPPMYTNYTVSQCKPATNVNCPFVAVFTVTPPLGCKLNCYLDTFTNVPASEGTLKVQVDNGTIYPLTASFPYLDFAIPNGTIRHITLLNTTTFTGASSGARYVWKQWQCNSCGIASTSSATLTTPNMYANYTDPRSVPLKPQGAVTAYFDKQFPLTLRFTDNSTNPISPPSSLQLAYGPVNSQTVVTLTSYSGIWTSTANVLTIQNVTWEGVSGIEIPGQTIDMSNGPVTKAVVLKVYTATVKAVDLGNNPVAGVTVTVTLYNQTKATFTTNSQGLAQIGYIPIGTYTAQVSYQGKQVCNCVANAAQTSVYTVQISTGVAPGTQTVVSAVVLLAIFGVAAFLLILAIKVRKSPPPPSIQ